MAIIVEDGTGLATAQSYVSVAECDAYHAARGNSDWTSATLLDRERALVRATAALDGRYSTRWPGIRADDEQALDWPRYDALDSRGYEIDSGSVPREVKNATCEAALVEILTPGELSAAQERGGQVAEETVGPITTKYFPGASSSKTYPAISQALARIIASGQMGRR